MITNADKLRKTETERNHKTFHPFFSDQNKFHVCDFQSDVNLYYFNEKMKHYILTIQLVSQIILG